QGGARLERLAQERLGRRTELCQLQARGLARRERVVVQLADPPPGLLAVYGPACLLSTDVHHQDRVLAPGELLANAAAHLQLPVERDGVAPERRGLSPSGEKDELPVVGLDGCELSQ